MRLSVIADEVCLDSDRCWRVGLIIAELIRNATRHGFSGGPGSIRVEIAEASGLISCEVSDDGGVSSNAGSGRGLRLVQSLAMGLGGSVQWQFTPDGCSAHLQFARATGAGSSVASKFDLRQSKGRDR